MKPTSNSKRSSKPSPARAEVPRLLQPGARRRRTVAVLVDYRTLFVGAYEGEIRTAFDVTCRRLGLDLLLVYGEAIDEPHSASAAHNSIYNLLGPDSVDGVVALTSSIGTYCGTERMAAFLKQYGTMPLCSLGVELEGVPSVLVDHRAGMLALVEH